MIMTRVRGLKSIVISWLIVLSASCFSLLFVNAYSSFIQQEDVKASYIFSSTEFTDNDYNNNSIFEINNKAGFKTFCNYANNFGYDVICPEKNINEANVIEKIRKLNIDLVVVTSYNQKFLKELLITVLINLANIKQKTYIFISLKLSFQIKAS